MYISVSVLLFTPSLRIVVGVVVVVCCVFSIWHSHWMDRGIQFDSEIFDEKRNNN